MLLSRFVSSIKEKISPFMQQKEAKKLASTVSMQENEGNFTLEIIPTKKNTTCIGDNWLIRYKNNDHSEHGEDGIIDKIFELIPVQTKWVCEFGAHDPEIISNTWKLINERCWNAVLIEADDYYFQKLKDYYKENERVHCIHSKVSYEGVDLIDNILSTTPISPSLDLMIIDIDGNDFHVWKTIQLYQAKVVMIEFNAAIPTTSYFIQPALHDLNQGSSLSAMQKLGSEKGYKLIAVTSWNAFFVKEEYFSLFFKKEPQLEDLYVYPAKHPICLRAFQLYDGSINVISTQGMLWHKVDLDHHDYQVLPKSFRVFSRELSSKNYLIESSGEKTPLNIENSEYYQKLVNLPGNSISKYRANSFSKYGEDGILEKLVSLVSANYLYLVDVGAWDGITNSRTRNLVVNHKWSALQIESEENYYQKLVKNCQDFERVKTEKSLYKNNQSNLNSLLIEYNAPKDFDLLCLNVFGMEYYLWESIKDFSPKIVAIQFNPTIPNDVKFIQEKNPLVHQGCSLSALYDLARFKNYTLVGVTPETAFFVQNRYIYRFMEQISFTVQELDSIFIPLEMQLFQLYDGTIALRELDYLLWHKLKIDIEKLQVVPTSLRRFHQFADEDYKKFFYRI